MASNTKAETDTAPDPEEDDLDDLDDVLDEFPSQPKPTSPKPTPTTTTTATPTASGPGRPPSSSTIDSTPPPPSEDAELASQLQAGMTNLIGELGSNPAMQKQFEGMMQELLAAGAAPSQHQAAEHVKRASENMPELPSEDLKGAGGKKEENFQDTIRKTMERMQASGDAATAASTSTSGTGATSEEEMLAEMMKQLGGGGEGAGSEEDFNTMLMSMMTQLTNKEILYEPMKELHEKFPAWMEAHKDDAEAGDLERYVEQQRLVGEIVGRFERRGYSDEDERDREFIVERMQKMQAAGSPPPDLVGDMSDAQSALGDLEAGCPTQ